MPHLRRNVLPVLFTFLVAFASFPVAFAQPAEVHGIDTANMDLSVDPGVDFYRYANGGWLDRTTIPADEGSFGNFTELHEQTVHQLLSLLAGLEQGGTLKPDSDEAKAVALYKQGTDMTERNANGFAPIEPFLAQIDAIASLEDAHRFLQGGMLEGVTGVLPVGVGPDLGDSGVNAAYLGGPWLGLPNRDYYTKDDADNQRVRAAYVDADAKFLVALGADPASAAKSAQAVYDFEARLAEPTLTREQQQDVSLSYNPTPLADLVKRYPMMDWSAYFSTIGMPPVDSVIVTETKYLDALPAILQATPIDTVKDYLKVQLVWAFAGSLSADLEQTAFDFGGKVLGGREQMKPLDERVLGDVDGAMGEALGKLYVAAYFPPEAKAQIERLVADVLAAFRGRLEENAWMSPETKAKALDKLAAVRVKVGYPDVWRTYEKVTIGDSYARSLLNAGNAEQQRQLAEAGKPVDRNEWEIPPQTVNAYYNPLNNEIVFPAGILQAPFFDYRADAATNYGGIGYVIGHEITHGFDLQGSQFDAQGNLANWWTPEDQERFKALNDRLVKQYDAIEVLPGLHINGQITVTENAADLGGIQVAYAALQRRLATASAPLPAPPLAGTAAPPQPLFTPNERFFISAATVWRNKIRDTALVTQVKADPHSPAAVRATQPLRNCDCFYPAFDIGPGEPMFLPPEQRIVIW